MPTTENTGDTRTDLIPVLRGAMAGALALTGFLFVYALVTQGFTFGTWLLAVGWMPLIVWNYLALARGDVVSVGVAIIASFGLLIVTVMAIASGGRGVGLATGVVGLLMFGSMIAAGSVMWERAEDAEETDVS